jgi:hypothetical protein
MSMLQLIRTLEAIPSVPRLGVNQTNMNRRLHYEVSA